MFTDDVSAATLGAWLPDFTKQTQLVRKLVHAFYSGDFRVGKFIKEHPQHQSELVDLLRDDLFDHRSRKGRLILAMPGRMEARSGIDVIAFGESLPDAARVLRECFESRVALALADG